MIPLPIDALIPACLEQLKGGSLVLVAPPGSGKTTRLPAAIVESGLLAARHPKVVVLQPRRVAARAAARRVADERGWALGGEVGYQVRFERRLTDATRLRFVTEGVLTRQLLADPFLETVGAVVLDEFHERSLDTDLALALLREVRDEVRPDLLIVVMSATLDAEPVAAFLGGCPIVRAEGRSHPVDIDYRPADRPSSPEALAPGRPGVARRPARIGPPAGLPARGWARSAGRGAGWSPWRSAAGAVVLPLHGSLDRGRTGRGPAAGRSAEDHPEHEHRRDLADHRGRPHGDRQRPGPAGAVRPRARRGPLVAGADQPGLGRSARRPGGPHRARALHPALVRARRAGSSRRSRSPRSAGSISRVRC